MEQLGTLNTTLGNGEREELTGASGKEQRDENVRETPT